MTFRFKRHDGRLWVFGLSRFGPTKWTLHLGAFEINRLD